MWRWTSYAALSESSPTPDAARLCGDHVEVRLYEETAFVVNAFIEIRRVRAVHEDQARGSDVMVLRVRSAAHYSSGLECWTSFPKYYLQCGVDAPDDVAWTECLSWLGKMAKLCSRPTRPLGVPYTHAIASPDQSSTLRALAASETKPQAAVVVRRREIRTAVPSDSGMLLSQSDLVARGQLWRSVCGEAASLSVLRANISPVQALFEPSRCQIRPLILSPAQFACMLAQHKPEEELTPVGRPGRDEPSRLEPAQQEATLSQSDPPTAVVEGRWWSAAADAGGAAGGVEGGTGGNDAGTARPHPPISLKERLLDAWFNTSDVFSQRVHRAAQQHSSTPFRLAKGDSHLPSNLTGAPVAPPLTVPPHRPPPGYDDGSALRGEQPYGLLALVPSHVVSRAIGEAASAGHLVPLHQLLAGSRGNHLNSPCGVPEGLRRTPLQCAAANGHSGCVQLLLRSRAEPSATCEGGRTALHLAASGGTAAHAACVRLLLRFGCDATQPDLRGTTPIDLAQGARQSDCTEAMAPIQPTQSASLLPYATLAAAEVCGRTDVPCGPQRYELRPPPPPPTDPAWVRPLIVRPGKGEIKQASLGGVDDSWWSLGPHRSRDAMRGTGLQPLSALA